MASGGVMHRSYLGLSLLLAFFFCCSSFRVINFNGYGDMVGGRRDVKDVKNNKEIQDLGRFSVEKYNKNQRQYQDGGRADDVTLEFKEVVKAQTQVVSGFKYYLTIRASHDGILKTYDAIVIVKPWVRSKQLITFAPSIEIY